MAPDTRSCVSESTRAAKALDLSLVMLRSIPHGPSLALPAEGISVRLVEAPDSIIDIAKISGEGSAISAFLDRDPEDCQRHICFAVPDIVRARIWFKERGVRFLGGTRIGTFGTPAFFLLPQDTGEILTEIMEEGRAT